MKILTLNYEFPPLGGGASAVSFELAKELSRDKRFAIDIVTMNYKGMKTYEEINDRLHIHRVNCLRSRKEICHPQEQLTYLVSAYFKINKLLRQNEYDLCHAHFLIPTGILAYILNKQTGLKYLITSHGSDVPGFNPDRLLFLHQFTRPILRLISRGAERITDPSRFLQQLILKNISQKLKQKITIIPNGIDINKLKPRQKEKYILSTGRFLPRKGFQYLIKAVSHKDYGYPVHLVGNGPMFKQLKKLAAKSKTKIVFHGWLDNKSEKYKNLLEKAAIFCLFSNRESSGMSLMEAMSAGCAVITTTAGGGAETVGHSGFLLPPKNYLPLRKKIEFLIKNQRNLKKYQLKARQKAEKNFAWKVLIKKYKKLYYFS